MSLDTFSREELKNKSMLEISSLILKDAKKALSFQEIFDKVAEIRELTDAEKKEKIAQFYTELNVDGRFMTIGSNVWGLKEWYTVEQQEELITTEPEPKVKRKSKRDDDEDLELEEDDEDIEELEDDIDALIDEDDEDKDELDDDFEDLDDEILDEEDDELLDEELDFEDEEDEEENL